MHDDEADPEVGGDRAPAAGERPEPPGEPVGGRRRRRRVAERPLARRLPRVGHGHGAEVDVGPEHRQLEHAAVARDRGVGRVRAVGGDGAEHRAPARRPRAEREPRQPRPVATTGRRARDLVLIQHKGNGVRDERGDRQAGDRHQALGHAREAEWRQSLPERLVQRQARAERQHARHDGGEPEEEREPALTPDRPEAGESEDRSQPAEEHVLLDARSDPARDEVGELGRVVPHLAEGAAAARDRARRRRPAAR